MVNGLQMPVKVLAVDLDGTLLSCNSLHAYMRAGIKCLWRKRCLFTLAKAASLLGARKLHLISHTSMKFVMARIVGWDNDVKIEFEKEISGKLNNKVLDIISRHLSKGGRAVLATAAFDFYIPSITALPFIATQSANNPLRLENRGSAKAEALTKWLEENQCQLEAVITDDQVDDASLLELPCPLKYIVRNGNPIPID